jgi:hypothetical protein
MFGPTVTGHPPPGPAPARFVADGTWGRERTMRGGGIARFALVDTVKTKTAAKARDGGMHEG